jgi:hypothetical protein
LNLIYSFIGLALRDSWKHGAEHEKPNTVCDQWKRIQIEGS